MSGRHLRGTAPVHDVRDGGYAAGIGPEGSADQRGGLGGDQGSQAGDGGETRAVKVRLLPLDTPGPVEDT